LASKNKTYPDIQLTIDKLVNGGQGMGSLDDGSKAFVWNALPGERVTASITKKRAGIIEAIATEVLEVSPERIKPADEAYMSTSPWQVMTWEAENRHKQAILADTFQRLGITAGDIKFTHNEQQWHYRNKMEYSFWGNDEGLHLALFERGSHGKQIITGSSLARPEIDMAANKILQVLRTANTRAGVLKAITVRCDQDGRTVAALFVKNQRFPKLAGLEETCHGITVYYSNPNSPANVMTRQLYTFGEVTLTDRIAGHDISYDVHSFFQVNLPLFADAVARITRVSAALSSKIDLYSGVGTIGIAAGAGALVEIDSNNIHYATQNIARAGGQVELIHASTETSLASIEGVDSVIVDPPRAGLHKAVLAKLLAETPRQVVYLSCNPVTLMRDLGGLAPTYAIESLEGYNFFPRTPHIEALAVLKKV